MKWLFTILFISALSIGAEAEKKGAQQPNLTAPRYRHVQDADGKILATIDTKDNSIDFKASREDAFRALLSILDNVVTECNKALANKAPLKVEEKKVEKKK